MNKDSKERILRLFQFLKQYNNIKNPIITDILGEEWYKWLDDLPQHETIVNNIYSLQDDEVEEILKVKRPVLKECPKLPVEIKDWVEKGWENINGQVKIRKEIKLVNEFSNQNEDNENKYIIKKFQDDKRRIDIFNQWERQREQWLKQEIPARAVDDLFNILYELYSNIKKNSESLELILGDGLLLYKKDVFINHPILLQYVKLEFDANVPEFKLIPSDKGTEIYRSLFYNIEDINNELLKGIYNDFEENNYSPIELKNTSSFLNRIANALSAKGKFFASKSEVNDDWENPQIYRRPVLFLRKRNLGFGIAIDSIIEDIKNVENMPSFLEEVVGCIEENSLTDENSNAMLNLNPNGIDEDILLTKPANSEQLAVAKYFESNSAVLVQGPPGTGKTHTIANMIGHLLSQGKSILVTSYSEKALSVLKGKVAHNLQSLCLSLLSTTEGRQEMEKTLDGINENRSRLNPITLAKEVELLQKTRKEYLTKLDDLKSKLKNARLNEYRPIVISGEEYKPLDAAKFINEYKDTHNWIPTPVKLGAGLSLTEEEIVELYETNKIVSKEEEQEYDYELPKLEELKSPIDFQNLIYNKSKFSEEKLKKYEDCWNSRDINYTIEDLKSMIIDLNTALEHINLDSEWTLATIEASKEETIKQSWVNLINEVNDVYKMKLEISEEILEYNPEFEPVDDKIDVRKQLELIVNKLDAGGKITKLNLMFNSDMKTTINSCRINGSIPKHDNEYKALLKYYDLIKARKQLANRWNRQIACLGADNINKMGKDFEVVCKKYCTLIKENLSWYENYWNPIISKLKSMDFNLNQIDHRIDLSNDKYSRLRNIKSKLGVKLIDILNSEIYRLEYFKYLKMKESIVKLVNQYSTKQDSKIIAGLQEALINEDLEMYKKYYEALVKLNGLSKYIERRRYLLNKLSKIAPAWAKEIENRDSIHRESKPPKGVKEAWLFVQFNEELKERNSQSIEAIQNDMIELEDNIKQNTAELAFKKAWQAKLEEFQNNKRQVQYIEGWRQLIRKIGSGKGKRAAIYKAEARKLMPNCQSAVPVWIMPLSKVVENFNPSENKFDVVIIDEASQADVMALVALYLGKKVIIVGDNEQVSPLSIGEKTEDIDRLIREYLYDIPNDKLYCGKFSIYDLAQASGYQPIRLKEHFRCVPEIIQYSNILSYNRQIKPLRDDSEVTTKPATVTYRVEGATSHNKINEKEAKTIVSLILACSENEEYKDKTIGVITLRGDKQAVLVDRLLQKKMNPLEYRKREVLCGNSANFQGDERDIIFLSMVDTNEGEGPLRRNGYGNDDLYKKRYNVAVSRARDQIWLVHSIDSENDLKPGDIRKELIDYLKNPHSKDIEYDTLSKEAESEFEKEVMRYLIDGGYKIVPQWHVGSFRIDMVAIYNDKKIAIECDGEKWHGEEKFEEDMIRQSILERLGWRFIRIRGSKFYRDKIQTMKGVCDKLNNNGIYPTSSEATSKNLGHSSLVDRVKSMAEVIRTQWEKEEV
ncbi:RecBCD enzyme subunit RecD [Clostridium ragsdalei P11]|uniref:RecBCD enzyme subunit RecD n=1 Tax=Clostridium ragsdalei P11 TaxID=1353534 RepID=A0A1A6AIX8_9CLOT|nr:AAA domain-containing protein [Clostridium ragsdalei]OBR90027.1 RecBCD enzyme subunit RecD [Clostridium ragsdalei P11]